MKAGKLVYFSLQTYALSSCKTQWFPILILIYVKEYFIAPVFAILFFIIAYFAPVIIVLFINQEVQPIKHLEAWIYFLGVFINVAFAYKSNIVLRWSIRNAEARKIVTKWDKYFAVTYTRIFSYVVLILVYISYNVWAFTNPEHIPLGLNVVKEILVTFVSIDTLFQIIISSKKEKKI
ncbi:hypothetical protein [Kurthia zopfii]|uniref:hypothetical protein n=1 Tax=Kurthia zopfii TaxID=1650 RepID=UPI0011AB813D|nr:hypothetical protein [Kurthia zopfii]